MKHIGDAIGGALVIAAVSTFGDYLWANFLPHHRSIYGLTHGTLLFLAVGLYLGMRAHKAAIGAIGGGLLGFLAAGSFYVLSPVLGYAAMFLMYIGVWVGVDVVGGCCSAHFSVDLKFSAEAPPIKVCGSVAVSIGTPWPFDDIDVSVGPLCIGG